MTRRPGRSGEEGPYRCAQDAAVYAARWLPRAARLPHGKARGSLPPVGCPSRSACPKGGREEVAAAAADGIGVPAMGSFTVTFP